MGQKQPGTHREGQNGLLPRVTSSQVRGQREPHSVNSFPPLHPTGNGGHINKGLLNSHALS